MRKSLVGLGVAAGGFAALWTAHETELVTLTAPPDVTSISSWRDSGKVAVDEDRLQELQDGIRGLSDGVKQSGDGAPEYDPSRAPSRAVLKLALERLSAAEQVTCPRIGEGESTLPLLSERPDTTSVCAAAPRSFIDETSDGKGTLVVRLVKNPDQDGLVDLSATLNTATDQQCADLQAGIADMVTRRLHENGMPADDQPRIEVQTGTTPSRCDTHTSNPTVKSNGQQ